MPKLKKKKEEIELVNKADSTIFQTERQLKEYGDKIPADKKQPIEDALAELKKNSKQRISRISSQRWKN